MARPPSKSRLEMIRRNRKSVPEGTAIAPVQSKDITTPANFVGKNGGVTRKALDSGSYQKKIMAFFAPHLIPEAMNGLRRAMKDNNIQAIRTTLEQYGVIQPAKGATTIFAPQFNNSNENKAAAIAAAAAEKSKKDGPSDFEDILRVLDEGRPTIDLRNKEVLATPEGAIED